MGNLNSLIGLNILGIEELLDRSDSVPNIVSTMYAIHRSLHEIK